MKIYLERRKIKLSPLTVQKSGNGVDCRVSRHGFNYCRMALAVELTKVDKEVKHNAVSNWENAKSTPNIDQFVKYCQICGADFAEMLNKVYGDPEKTRRIFNARLLNRK